MRATDRVAFCLKCHEGHCYGSGDKWFLFNGKPFDGLSDKCPKCGFTNAPRCLWWGTEDAAHYKFRVSKVGRVLNSTLTGG